MKQYFTQWLLLLTLFTVEKNSSYDTKKKKLINIDYSSKSGSELSLDIQHLLSIFVKAQSQTFRGSPEMQP